MTEIRFVEDRDIPAIASLMKWAAESTVATFTVFPEDESAWRARWIHTRALYPWLVAYEGDAMAGFAKAGPFREKDAYAYTVEPTVYVHPEHHGKGVGRKLYDRLFSLLHRQGYFTAIAVVTGGNAAAIAFHERVGMKRIGTLERVGWKFDRWQSIVFFELMLQDVQQQPGPILQVTQVG